MAMLLDSMGNHDEAFVYIREALAGQRRVLGDDHPETLRSIENIGLMLHYLGRHEEGLVFCREALAGRRRVLGNDHPKTLASIGNVGAILYQRNRLDEAIVYYREALVGRRRILGDDHQKTLNLISAMGDILLDQGKPDDAMAVLAPADAAARRVFVGDDRRRLGLFLISMGRAHAASGAFHMARTNLDEATEILSEAPGVTKTERGDVLIALVDLYETWHAAEPDQDHDRQAAAYEAKLEELKAGG